MDTSSEISASSILISTVGQMFSHDYYLGVNIFILVLQGLSIVGNSIVIFLFMKSKRMRLNQCTRLIFLLSISDCLFAAFDLPHIIYLISNWVPGSHFYYSPVFTVVSDLPLTFQLKINLMLTLYIALDRLQAIRFPIYHRKKDKILHKRLFLFSGILWGLIDSILEIVLTNIQNHFAMNDECAAAGCFTSVSFKTYWAICNTILGAIGVALTMIFGHELNMLRKKNKEMKSKSEGDKKLEQANKLSMGILLNSTIFLMLPSAVIGTVNIVGLSIFQQLGPFYSFCLLSAGFTNSIVYLTLHEELKNEAKRLIRQRKIRVELAPRTSQMNVPSPPQLSI